MKNRLFILSLVFSLSLPSPSFSLENFKVEKTMKTILKSKTIVVFESAQKTFPKMIPIKSKIKLFDKKNKPVEKASVLMDLTMPEMYMPKNEVSFKEEGKGIYSGELLFTMKGAWRLDTYITLKGKKEKVYFDIEVE